MIINEHLLIRAKDAGNGYHGYCKHCSLSFVTDLGYCSWDNTKCIDREITNWLDCPDNVRSYARFRGFIFNTTTRRFSKAYSSEEYTINQFIDLVNSIIIA